MIKLLLALHFLFAQSQVPLLEAEDENPAPITLLEAAPAVCPDGEAEGQRECEKIIIHEAVVNKLQYLIVDGRNKKNGNFDANRILKNPEDYYGQIKTIDLEEIYKDVEKPIQLTGVHFVKGGKIRIKFRNISSDHEKIIPEP